MTFPLELDSSMLQAVSKYNKVYMNFSIFELLITVFLNRIKHNKMLVNFVRKIMPYCKFHRSSLYFSFG